jgi:hypothetical protein
MISKWYIPSWSGDFRLEAEGEDSSRLIVVDPTPAEVEQLGKFLVKARKKGWVANIAGVSETGESTLKVGASVVDSGKLLLGRCVPRKGLLTAVKSVGGKLEVVDGDAGSEPVTEALDTPEADKAVTTRRPTLCCPTPQVNREVRASEVLRTFCTRRQWEEWMDKGYLHCIGNLSGHSYRIVHRHHPLAAEQTKVCWDLHDDIVVHCYDWSVPPPEEALAIKLTLEYREHWIRNLSGMYTLPGAGAVSVLPRDHKRKSAEVYPDPFMSEQRQILDGTTDAGFVIGFGTALKAFNSVLGSN